MNKTSLVEQVADMERQIAELRRRVQGNCISASGEHDWVTGRSGTTRQCRVCARLERIDRYDHEPLSGVECAAAYARMRRILQTPDYAREIATAAIETTVEIIEKGLVLGPLSPCINDDLGKRLREIRRIVALSRCSEGRGSAP